MGEFYWVQISNRSWNWSRTLDLTLLVYEKSQQILTYSNYPACHLMSEHTKICHVYIVREHVKFKCNDNHTISRQSKIKTECKSILHFPIIKNVAVEKPKWISGQTSKTVPSWFSWSQGWGIHSSTPWSKSEFRALLLSLAVPFSLLWLIPAALWVSASKQDTYKSQGKKKVFQLPQNPE